MEPQWQGFPPFPAKSWLTIEDGNFRVRRSSVVHIHLHHDPDAMNANLHLSLPDQMMRVLNKRSLRCTPKLEMWRELTVNMVYEDGSHEIWAGHNLTVQTREVGKVPCVGI